MLLAARQSAARALSRRVLALPPAAPRRAALWRQGGTDNRAKKYSHGDMPATMRSSGAYTRVTSPSAHVRRRGRRFVILQRLCRVHALQPGRIEELWKEICRTEQVGARAREGAENGRWMSGGTPVAFGRTAAKTGPRRYRAQRHA